MKSTLTCFILILSTAVGFCQVPVVVSGTLKRYENFPSKLVEARNVDVWLPDGYSPKTKYAVLYMHDGQSLFDSTTTWNHQSWDVDDVAARLINQHRVQPFIVVGIWNAGKSRHADYFPQKPYESLTPTQRKFVEQQLQSAGRTTSGFQPDSDKYLQFLVTELKPFIDKTYSVYPDPNHTFIAGSSMGGLISMYALCEYPAVFGGAACLSTHWPGVFSMDNNPIPDAFVSYLKMTLPNPSTHKLYFDYGDQTLDAMYPPLQQKVDAVMKQKGYSSAHWQTRFFPGENHSEKSWAKRLAIPVEFLLSR